jgi:hypothetical protein
MAVPAMVGSARHAKTIDESALADDSDRLYDYDDRRETD